MVVAGLGPPKIILLLIIIIFTAFLSVRNSGLKTILNLLKELFNFSVVPGNS